MYSEDLPVDMDVIVAEPDGTPNEKLLRGVLGSFRILYGDGRYLLAFAKRLGDPTFDEAMPLLRVAALLLKLALETKEPLDRDRLIRDAFDALLHAARIAAMSYLSTEVSRWGIIRRMLPEPYRSEFRTFINKLHIENFYPASILKKKWKKNSKNGTKEWKNS
ncbi:MAG: hypothetical protein ACTSXJ_00500 [Candidatus Baldrarchaeia archaeon]